MKTKLFFIALLSLSSSLNAQEYDENVDGDLSNDFMYPTVVNFVNRDLEITSNQQGTPRDVDYFTFTVPAGSALTEIFIDSFSATDPNNSAFIGIQAGSSFSTDENSTTAADLLGGRIFGAQDEDLNILAPMGLLGGAIGYAGPLPAGDYTIWLNQTGDNSSSMLTLLIEPAEITSLIWVDNTNGDLSDDNTQPTGVFKLNDGLYELNSEVQGAPRDVDYFTFEIPPGKVLSQIIVDFYDVDDASNLSFIGIVSGNSFPNDANTTTPADLLGGKSFGLVDEGNDILQDMGSLPGAIGFSRVLPAGTYSIWLNQTGDISDIDLILEVTDESLSTTNFDIENTVIFPNPTLNKVTVSAKNIIQSYTITDLSGRTLIPLQLVSNVNTNIDLSFLNSGLYFVNINMNNNSLSKKIIKK